MTLRNIDIEWNNLKTYATEGNLYRRLNEERGMYPDYDDRYMVVRTPEGRWTAIVLLDPTAGGYVGRYSFLKV